MKTLLELSSWASFIEIDLKNVPELDNGLKDISYSSVMFGSVKEASANWKW